MFSFNCPRNWGILNAKWPRWPKWPDVEVKMQSWGVIGQKLLFRWSRDQCLANWEKRLHFSVGLGFGIGLRLGVRAWFGVLIRVRVRIWKWTHGTKAVKVISGTFTKSLAQILSRDISFYEIVATRKGYFNNIIPTITLAINPNLTPTLIPTLTLTQAVKNEMFV